MDQERYFCDDQGNILVDDIFRYEKLAESVPTICERAGWPQFELNRVVNDTDHGPYRDYFNDETKLTLQEFADKYGYVY